MERGDMLHVNNIELADIVMLETDIPADIHNEMCLLLSRMKQDARTLTYVDLKKIWPSELLFPFGQLNINRSISDRFPTSWSVQRGHHFFLWYTTTPYFLVSYEEMTELDKGNNISTSEYTNLATELAKAKRKSKKKAKKAALMAMAKSNGSDFEAFADRGNLQHLGDSYANTPNLNSTKGGMMSGKSPNVSSGNINIDRYEEDYLVRKKGIENVLNYDEYDEDDDDEIENDEYNEFNDDEDDENSPYSRSSERFGSPSTLSLKGIVAYFRSSKNLGADTSESVLSIPDPQSYSTGHNVYDESRRNFVPNVGSVNHIESSRCLPFSLMSLFGLKSSNKKSRQKTDHEVCTMHMPCVIIHYI
jgi:hypothetical protein